MENHKEPPSSQPRLGDTIELLAPAKDFETGVVAVNAGADAVYVGPAHYGARSSAGNSLVDIEQLAAYAHKYWARVYATVNTLLFDQELEPARELCHQLYQAGVDALIIQDMGLLEMDLPPIPLFASTQVHNHTPEKVAFLEGIGIQRVILARELSLTEIRAIRAATQVELETFIHGALCVSYSGQCALSYAIGGRSGNRGECAQPCRRRYSLVDRVGRHLVDDSHLLSLKDLNLSEYLRDLIAAGVCSFKIEGRLKDQAYVRNVVAHYRQRLDAILPDLGLRPSSSGQVSLDFDPDPNKTFNRGYTSYYLTGQRDEIASPQTPKHAGEPVGVVTATGNQSFTLNVPASLNNGDGLTFFDAQGRLQGTLVNGVAGCTITPAKMDGIHPGTQICRNADREFLKAVEKSQVERRIPLRMQFEETPEGFRFSAQDRDGNQAVLDWNVEKTSARSPEGAAANLERQLTRLGESEFTCAQLDLDLSQPYFFPLSNLNALRRNLVAVLQADRARNFPRWQGGAVVNEIPYPQDRLNYLGNVLNHKARQFYQRHGVREFEPAAESGLGMAGRKVMTTKHCLRYELGACPHQEARTRLEEPLYLVNEAGLRLRLVFDCKACLMEIYYEQGESWSPPVED